MEISKNLSTHFQKTKHGKLNVNKRNKKFGAKFTAQLTDSDGKTATARLRTDFRANPPGKFHWYVIQQIDQMVYTLIYYEMTPMTAAVDLLNYQHNSTDRDRYGNYKHHFTKRFRKLLHFTTELKLLMLITNTSVWKNLNMCHSDGCVFRQLDLYRPCIHFFFQ